MFFARFKKADGTEHAELYNGRFAWDKYHSDTFSPLTEHIAFIEFKLTGNDYQSRKRSCENIAVEWSHADTSGLYMSELIDISDWFYKNGKRYGLLNEFRENAIC